MSRRPDRLGRFQYRAGVFQTFLADMQERFSRKRSGLNLSSSDHFITGLMAGWAEVCDILTFYQEQIAREGYLPVALEERSVQWLARQIGYRPRPSLSAQAPVSFRFIGSRAKGGDGQLIPRRTVVQSVPKAGGAPLLFETVADLEALPAADSIAAWHPPVVSPATMHSGAASLRLESRARVHKGQWLLIVGSSKDPSVSGGLWYFGPITAIDTDPVHPSKVVRWEGGIPGPLAALPSVAVDAYVLEGRNHLFGFRSPPWSKAPDTARLATASRPGGVLVSSDHGATWSTANPGLPAGIWQAVAGDGDEWLAGGSNGIYRSSDAGVTWELSALRGRPVFSLVRAPTGDFIAGTTNGGLYRSVDGGSNWDAMSGALLGDHRLFIFRRKMSQIPPVSVRSLLAPAAGDRVVILAGTDSGLFRWEEGGAWLPASKGLPGWNEKSGTAQTAVYALAHDPRDKRLYAGTSRGLYASSNRGESWECLGPRTGPHESIFARLRHRRAPSQPPQVFAVAALFNAEAKQTVLLAGTAAGILRSVDHGRNWTTVFTTETRELRSVVNDDTTIAVLAGTAGGIYRSSDYGQTWQPAGMNALRFQAPGDVSVPLTAGPLDRNWMAAFRQAGIRLSADSKIEITPGQPAAVVDPESSRRYSVAAEAGAWSVSLNAASPILAIESSNGRLLAAGPTGDVLENEWPGTQGPADSIDLDSPEDGLVPGSWAVVSELDGSANSGAAAVAFQIAGAGPVVADGLGLYRSTTRVQPAQGLDFSAFDPRVASVDLHSRRLPLFEPAVPPVDVLQGQSITLAGDFSTWRGGRSLVVSGARPRVFVDAPLGGLLKFASPDSLTRAWPDQDARAVASAADGSVAVAIAGTGIFVAPNKPASPAKPLGQPKGDVTSLVWVGGVLWAAGPQGIWKRGPQDKDWSDGGLAGRQFFALAAGRAGQLFAGTDDGVYQLPSGGSWSSAGLNGKHAILLALDASGDCIAAVREGGVFVSRSAGQWKPLAAQAEFLRASALAAGGGRVTIAAHGGGVFRFDAGSSRMTRIDRELPLITATALATDSAGVTYLALPGWGLASEQNGAWKRLPIGVANAIRALAALPGGGVAAAAGLALTAVDAQAASVSRTPAGSIPKALASDLDARLFSGDLKSTLATAGIQLKTVLDILVLEPHCRWRIVSDAAETLYLRIQDAAIGLFQDDAIHLMQPADSDGQWRFDTGAVFANPGELSLWFAEPAAPTVSEAVTTAQAPVLTLDGASAISTVQLTTALENVYDASTVRVAGNTVSAIQGETVHEVLGSGDAGRKNQCFALHRKPLSVIPGQGSDGLAPQISVFITSHPAAIVHPRARHPLVPRGPAIEWRLVDALLEAGPNDPAYALEPDESGIPASVCFGDGVHGARLPSGAENVSAEYQVGAGESGNVGPGEISVVRAGPPLRMRVSNLVAAQGGTPPEPPGRIRRRAPLSLQVLNRVVSLDDYERYAAVFPGIEQSCSLLLETGQGPSLVVTISALGNQPPSQGLLNDLKAAIDAARASSEPFEVIAYRPAPFHLHLTVSPDGSVDPADLVRTLSDSLERRFGLAAARFRARIAASDIVTMVEETPGVLNGVVDALYRTPGPVLREPLLIAQSAKWDKTQKLTEADELLYLDLPRGLRLRLEPGR